MKNQLLAISITLLLAACASVEKYNLQISKLHSIEDLQDDTDKFYKQLKRNHPHLYQFTSKAVLDYKFDSLKTALVTPMDSRTFYKQLAKVSKHVGQGHLSVSPPFKHYTRKEKKQRSKMKFAINNLDFEYLDNTLFVTNARGADTVLINSEVLKIEEENPVDLIKKYKQLIASDGYNTTFHNRVVGTRFMSYYIKDKGRFDSITLTFKNSDSTFIKKYRRVLKDAFVKTKDTVTKDSTALKPIKKLTKAEKKAKKLKLKQEYKDNRTYGYNPIRKENTRNLSFVGKDSTIALMKIRGFKGGKYKWFYEAVFTTLDSLKTETLIIDLRNNFGGRLKEIAVLYSYLTDKNFTFINPSEVNSRIPVLKSVMSNSNSITTKAFIGLLSPVILVHNVIKTSKKDGKLYYDFKVSKEQEPNPKNFKGKIYVLINGNSFSASSILSTKLKEDKRATFVGEETGGAHNGTVAGIYKIYELPHTKIKARIGLMHIDVPYKINPDGYGVQPDVVVLPSYKDRLNTIDPELEWVLKDVQTKK
ncbi:MAG: S41 family peptidase [Winogradskyella sp.]